MLEKDCGQETFYVLSSYPDVQGLRYRGYV